MSKIGKPPVPVRTKGGGGEADPASELQLYANRVRVYPRAVKGIARDIKWAILILLGAVSDAPAREALRAGFVSLAEWQDPADFDTAAFDSTRLRRKMDPLALAREFAARATPRHRWLEASRAEQAVLIDELKRRGFW